MEEGLLSLKWNNHNSTFFQNLSILREKHTYTDVTLACDGRLYPVHKFILSTCSEYFSDIFTSNSGNNIVIVLKDVRRQDLEYLLDYMYLGQVDVAQSELSSLIKTAECLKIKGLAIPDDEPQTPSRRGTEERDPDSSPPSKKKRHHADENRTVGVSSNNSNNISSRVPPILAIPPPSLPPHTVQQQQALLQRLQVPVSQSQHPPTSQPSGKVHSSSLTHIASPRTLQVTTGSAHPSHVPPLSSPTQPSSMPLIKQEVTEPPESEYGNESFEESKPDVSESQHLEQDMAVAGPSGIQGSADNWDGESDLSGYAGGEAYPEGGMEESGDSEAQGDGREGTEAHLRSVGHHDLDRPLLLGSDQQGPENVGLPLTESVYGVSNLITRKIDEESVGSPVLAQGEPKSHYQKGTSNATQISGLRDSRKGEFSQTVSSDLDVFGTSESSDDIIFEGSTLGDSSQELSVLGANPLSSVAGSSSQQASAGAGEPADERLPGSDYTATDQQQWKQLLGYDSSTSRYVCQWCGRNFDRISNLKRHVLLHSGIKPFKCLYCNYRATQKANVVQHVASRHRDEMRALLNNNINVNDMLVPTPGMKS